MRMMRQSRNLHELAAVVVVVPSSLRYSQRSLISSVVLIVLKFHRMMFNIFNSNLLPSIVRLVCTGHFYEMRMFTFASFFWALLYFRSHRPPSYTLVSEPKPVLQSSSPCRSNCGGIRKYFRHRLSWKTTHRNSGEKILCLPRRSGN